MISALKLNRVTIIIIIKSYIKTSEIPKILIKTVNQSSIILMQYQMKNQ